MKHLSSTVFFTLLCTAYSLQAATQQIGSLTFPPASEAEALGLSKPPATTTPAAPTPAPASNSNSATAKPIAAPSVASTAPVAPTQPVTTAKPVQVQAPTPTVMPPTAAPMPSYTQGMQFPPQANRPAVTQYPSVQQGQAGAQFPQTGYAPNAAYPAYSYPTYPQANYGYSPYGYSTPNYGYSPYSYGYNPYSYGYSNPYNRLTPYTLRPPVPQNNTTKEKHAWGDIRNIWPDFYTDMTNDMWDKMINGPYDMGYMPGGWRFPSLSSPDPVTVGDAVANQVPPFARESGNMMPFHNMRNFSPF